MKFLIYIMLIISFGVSSGDQHHHDNKKHKNEKKSLKAHEHGVSILNIAQDSSTISFQFEMPGFDVVGFEHKAKKKEDIKRVKEALNILSENKNMIIISDAAGCTEENNSSKVVNKGVHSEFLSTYIFICKNISSIDNIEIKYLKSFKYSKKLNINLITKNKKATVSLDKSDHNLKVKGYF